MKNGISEDVMTGGGPRVYRDKSDVEFDNELSREMVKRTDKLGKDEVDLALQVKQAREFLDWNCDHMKKAWFDWMEEASKAIRDMTTLRMALERESKTIIAATKDVHAFFNLPETKAAFADYEKLIALTEKMQSLKQSGALDALVDFWLALKS